LTLWYSIAGSIGDCS